MKENYFHQSRPFINTSKHYTESRWKRGFKYSCSRCFAEINIIIRNKKIVCIDLYGQINSHLKLSINHIYIHLVMNWSSICIYWSDISVFCSLDIMLLKQGFHFIHCGAFTYILFSKLRRSMFFNQKYIYVYLFHLTKSLTLSILRSE